MIDNQVARSHPRLLEGDTSPRDTFQVASRFFARSSAIQWVVIYDAFIHSSPHLFSKLHYLVTCCGTDNNSLRTHCEWWAHKISATGWNLTSAGADHHFGPPVEITICHCEGWGELHAFSAWSCALWNDRVVVEVDWAVTQSGYSGSV